MRIVVYDAGKIGLWVNDQIINIDEQIPGWAGQYDAGAAGAPAGADGDAAARLATGDAQGAVHPRG